MFSQMLYAQGGEAGGMGAMAPQLLMMGAIFAIFYFLLIRPQKQQQKKLQEAINSLKKGDKVIVANGVIAEFVSDKEDGSIAIVKLCDGVKVEVLKGAISSVLIDGPVKEDTKKVKGKKEEKNAIKAEIEKAEEKDKK